MERHPSYPVLAPLLQKYPRTAGSLFQTYNDLVHAQQWLSVETVELASCSRGAFKGQRPNTDSAAAGATAPAYVVPFALSETLSAAWMRDAFAGLGNPDALYMAITSEDSSIVYYKISRGIVKPPDMVNELLRFRAVSDFASGRDAGRAQVTAVLQANNEVFVPR